MPRMPSKQGRFPVKSSGLGPTPGNTSVKQQMATARDHHVAGRLPDAERAYRAILAQDPRHVEAGIGLASLALTAGNATAALNLLRQIEPLSPKNGGLWLLKSQASYHLGQIRDAVTFAEQAIAHKPRFPEAHLALGLASAAAGTTDAAEKAFRTAVRQNKQFVEAHYNLAALLLGSGRASEAEKGFMTVLRLAPSSLESLLGLAKARMGDRRPEDALDPLLTAIELAPTNGAVHHSLGRCYDALHGYQQAYEHFRKAVTLSPTDPAFFNDAGSFCLDDNRFDEGVSLCRQAVVVHDQKHGDQAVPGDYHLQAARALIRADRAEEAVTTLKELCRDFPDWSRPHRLLGDAYSRTGVFAKARAAYETALTLDPETSALLPAIAETGKIASDDPLVDLVRQRLDQPDLDDESRINAHYAMAKILSDAGDHPAAFSEAEAANSLQAKHQPFDADAHDAWIDRIIEIYTDAFFQSLSRPQTGSIRASSTPVLVVGLPRSGTTLVEQILAAHPQAAGVGELSHFGRLERGCPGATHQDPRKGFSFPDAGLHLPEAVLDDFAARYLEALGANRHDVLRVIDKMPSNFLRIGLFAQVFPNGRVIHCRRDPMDSCLSIFFQNFSAAHAYSHDLTALGRYAKSYLKLMEHWERIAPVPILPVDYETLVADQEGQSKRMIAFLDLDWTDSVLTYYDTVGTVATASAWQVRQPVYKGSVSRAARYGNAVLPLKQALDPQTT